MAALQLAEQAINSIRSKTISGARSSGYFMLSAALVFAGFAFVPLYGHIVWFLTFFLLFFALVFIISGVAFLRIAKKKEQIQ